MGRRAKSHCNRYGYKESINGGYQLWSRYIALLLLTAFSRIWRSLALWGTRIASIETTGVYSTCFLVLQQAYSHDTAGIQERIYEGPGFLRPRDRTGSSLMSHSIGQNKLQDAIDWMFLSTAPNFTSWNLVPNVSICRWALGKFLGHEDGDHMNVCVHFRECFYVESLSYWKLSSR